MINTKNKIASLVALSIASFSVAQDDFSTGGYSSIRTFSHEGITGTSINPNIAPSIEETELSFGIYSRF